MERDYAEIDLSEQIDNNWNKDTAIAIKKGGEYYSVKIRAKDKNSLKNKFIKEVKRKIDNKNNRRVVVIIYCFILYHLFKISGNLAKKVKICNDVSPRWAINMYLNKICSKSKEPQITNKVEIKFRQDGDPKSEAHYIAKKVARGIAKENLVMKKQHIGRLKYLIKTILEET